MTKSPAVVGLKELHDVVFGGTAIAGSETGAFDLGHYLLITASGLVIGVLSGVLESMAASS